MGQACGKRRSRALRWCLFGVLAGLLPVGPGCHTIPVAGKFQGDARVEAGLQGTFDVRLPNVTDPGPVHPVVVRESHQVGVSSRVGLIDVDGLLLNQNLTGLYSVGENPVASFREKLEAAARDPIVRAVVIRINSPGGGVTACDIMAEELRRFRAESGKPVVCCLMDLGTSGAYYLAVGADRVVAHPTSLTGCLGAVFNHYNLQDAMGQLNIVASPVKSGELVDMGSVADRMPDEVRVLLQETADEFHDRFLKRVAGRRPTMTADALSNLSDGRVVSAARALELGLVDRLGYIHDAIDEAERLAGVSGSQVALFQRQGYPARSLYAITPNTPIQGEIVPFSYPGLDRSKLPTFLYLWQPDPTVLRQGGR